MTGDVTEKIGQKIKGFDLVLMARHHCESYYAATETEHLMKKVDIPLMFV